MTNALKLKLEDIHNKYRQQIASGSTSNYEPATRMATMVSKFCSSNYLAKNVVADFICNIFFSFDFIKQRWDNELAKFAETNVRSCIFGHDKCRNTGKNLISLIKMIKDAICF